MARASRAGSPPETWPHRRPTEAAERHRARASPRSRDRRSTGSSVVQHPRARRSRRTPTLDPRATVETRRARRASPGRPEVDGSDIPRRATSRRGSSRMQSWSDTPRVARPHHSSRRVSAPGTGLRTPRTVRRSSPRRAARLSSCRGLRPRRSPRCRLGVDAGLLALLRRDRRRRAGQRVVAAAGLRERDDVADRVGAGQQRADPVPAERDAAVRRRAERERLEQEAELLLRLLRRRCPSPRTRAPARRGGGYGSSRRRSRCRCRRCRRRTPAPRPGRCSKRVDRTPAWAR